MGPAKYKFILRLHLWQMLVNHIAVRLDASEETSPKSLDRMADTAVILSIVIEEIGDILQLVHQSPDAFLIIICCPFPDEGGW